jgi:hypothetical protein
MKKMLRRFGLPSILLLALAVVAIAGSPHFIANLTNASVSSDGNLVVKFKEAGLESGAVETITASASATANWFCVNHGGGQPSASNKRTSTSEVSASGEFTAGKNGNVTGELTISPPPLTGDLTCPGNQTLELGSVTYNNVSITDETSGASLDVAGTFSTGCLIKAHFSPNVSCTTN